MIASGKWRSFWSSSFRVCGKTNQQQPLCFLWHWLEIKGVISVWSSLLVILLTWVCCKLAVGVNIFCLGVMTRWNQFGMTGVFLSGPRYDWCAPLSHPCSCMFVNHGLSQRSPKEEYKPWKWGATARYCASHTKTMLPTSNSVPRSIVKTHTLKWFGHISCSSGLAPQKKKIL